MREPTSSSLSEQRGVLRDRRVLLGVTGSIAAYKAADLASKLTQSGALVDVVMTKNALEFVSPLTFRSLTHRSVFTDLFDTQSEQSLEHIVLAEQSDVIVIAPATANVVAKVAMGMSDDLLTSIVLASRSPIVLAPSMDGYMYDNLATQENLAKLESRGHTLVGPVEGRLASGLVGIGRFTDVEDVIGAVKQVLGRDGDLASSTVLVTAGGTQEDIDPVRYVSNRSSGKMGYALAEAARDRGAHTVLISAPTTLRTPYGVDMVSVKSAAEMREAVAKAATQSDALIMAAAVADYRVASPTRTKVKKSSAPLSLELEATTDILGELKEVDLIKVGFAAESENLLANARQKLQDKALDLIVANDISAEDTGFGTDTNKVVIVDNNGKTEELPLLLKSDVARHILDRVAALISAKKRAKA